MSLSSPSSTWQRAEKALRCSPFCLGLFVVMGQAGVPLAAIAGTAGQEGGYSTRVLSENRVERELNWLIQVGLLRREVDGQGITDSFRLTPLGRQLVEQWQGQKTFPQPTPQDYLENSMNRLRHLAFNI